MREVADVGAALVAPFQRGERIAVALQLRVRVQECFERAAQLLDRLFVVQQFRSFASVCNT